MERRPIRNILYVLAAFFLIYLFSLIKQCSEPKETIPVKIEIPAKEGSFEKPTEVIPGVQKKDSIVYIKGKTIYTENPINKKLAEDYLKVTDSIEKLRLYLNAIQEREATYVYDNEDLKLEVYTKTRGELLELKPKYIIKPQDIKADIPIKQTVLAMYGGLELYNTSDLTNLTIKVDLGLQNKKGTIFTIGADTRSNFYVGAKIKFLDIKK